MYDAAMPITLYDGQRSPHARKVRLLAAELAIPLTRVALDFQKGELRAPEFLAKNPNGRIPTIEDDGFVLWESSAILKYLAAKRPDGGLAPSDPAERAQIDQWLFWWTADPEAAFTRLIWERRVKPFLGKPGNDPNIVADAEATFDRFLPVLDRQLAGKDYILGKLSIVDFAIAPVLDIAGFVGLDLGRYANITAWLDRLRTRPYWKDA
jgi:glutathione S-transferase